MQPALPAVSFLVVIRVPGLRLQRADAYRVHEVLDSAALRISSDIVKLAEKPLSFREKKMLERARHMLVTEISISRGLGEEEAIAVLQTALSRSSLILPEPA